MQLMDKHDINNNITTTNNNNTNNSCPSTSNSTVTADVTATSIATVDFNPTTAGSVGGGRDQFLRNLNKLSHKISKPAVPVTGRGPLPEPPVHLRPPPPPPPPPLQQPPVYNISKSDFRDVVQKLTGSPAHNRVQPPPPAVPIPAPKPASSRLQRIRPPPLAQLGNRPSSPLAQLSNRPPLLNCTAPMSNGYFRPTAPLSPLPPLPSCHASAESPISAYMRFLHSSISAVDSDLKFNTQSQPSFNFPTMLPPPQPQQQLNNPSSSSDSLASLHFPPSSPLPLACLPSPKSPCPLLSPKLLCSPNGTSPLGFPQLPISPTVPGVPSPK